MPQHQAGPTRAIRPARAQQLTAEVEAPMIANSLDALAEKQPGLLDHLTGEAIGNRLSAAFCLLKRRRDVT